MFYSKISSKYFNRYGINSASEAYGKSHTAVSQHKGSFVPQKYGRKENYGRKERGWPSIRARSCRGMSLRKRTGCCHTAMPLSSSLKYGLQALSITLCAKQNTHTDSQNLKDSKIFNCLFLTKKPGNMLKCWESWKNHRKHRIWLYSTYPFTVP